MSLTFLEAVDRHETIGVHHLGGHLFDELIVRGGGKVLDSANVAVTDVSRPDHPDDLDGIDAVVVHGGFRFSDFWTGGRKFVSVFGRCGVGTELIVAPSSYYFPNTDFGGLVDTGRRMTFFCREKLSAHRLRSERPPENVSIVEDRCPSLRLEDGDLPGGAWDGEYVIVAFRGDKESVLTPPMKSEIASLHSGSRGVVFKDVCSECGSFDDAIAAVRGASLVVTDRLHTGVAAHLVGTPVEYYPTVSGKLVHMYDDYLSEHSDISLRSIPP